MPQLDKFTSFTQFFWSCLFYVIIVLLRFLNIDERLYFLYVKNSAFQRVVLYLKFFVIFFIIMRAGFLLWHNYNHILLSPCGILPSELNLLEFYLKQSDPEWVEYVHQVLKTTPIHSATYEVMVRDFLNTEMCFVTRDQISSLYQLIFYGREDPQLFIDPQDLDSILKLHLEPLEFNHPALCQVLESLSFERETSPFYFEVKRTQAEHFQGFLKQKHQAQLEMQHRRELKELWESLSRRNAFLSEENASLRERLFILDGEAP
ncbi:hypothetical protein T459_03785 [Capsicum annuum]|uniref:ATP synthase YMF19-like N-terminal domain-containing protein n=3 Tax=Capsicum annuum TaxID=4072 RepID=A0A075VVC3_CAPAN|nr:hypothetical protein [Capsicum annuum]AIG90114.1 hypothetical protein [Capsicum annuum]PHT95903.1 hypothetical protein T459_03785 [Capsicum annuum]QFV19603.1 hypothetical protein [Capsicum annuum var. glabriusculum]